MATPMRGKRLMKELAKIQTDGLPPGIVLVSSGRDEHDMSEWLLDIEVLDANPLYRDKKFRLNFRFPNAYPIEPPEVMFQRLADRPVPIHPHIYSNGIICLDILGNAGWSPVQSVQSVCMSIQSMLTSNTKDERPSDDHLVRTNSQRPRDISFVYHDSTV